MDESTARQSIEAALADAERAIREIADAYIDSSQAPMQWDVRRVLRQEAVEALVDIERRADSARRGLPTLPPPPP